MTEPLLFNSYRFFVFRVHCFSEHSGPFRLHIIVTAWFKYTVVYTFNTVFINATGSVKACKDSTWTGCIN